MLIELTLLGGGVMAYWTKRNKRKIYCQDQGIAPKSQAKMFQPGVLNFRYFGYFFFTQDL